MSRWVIYDKSGGVRAVSDGLGTAVEWTLPELEYSGEWMGETFVTLNVRCAVPIEFEIGDYVVYRGEKFVMNYDPTVVKKARRGSYGEGFVYDNVKFNSLGYELTVARMLDYVLYGNDVHYSSLPKFSFFCTDVEDLADRLQVNMNRYCADNGFAVDDYWLFLTPSESRTVERARSYGLSERVARDRWAAASFSIVGAKVNQNVSIDNMSVWDSLKFIKDTFGLNFVVRGRSVVVGSAGLPTEDIFEYGKDKGLYEIERTADSEQQIVTKLFAYGSGKNLPVRYYADLNLSVFANVADIESSSLDFHYIQFHLDLDFDRKYFTFRSKTQPGDEQFPNFVVRMTARGFTVKGFVTLEGDTGKCRVYCEYKGTQDDDRDEPDVNMLDNFIGALTAGDRIDFESGVEKDAFPSANKDYAGGASALPNNMAVQVLMLPGFPSQSLYDWVLAHGGTAVGDTHNTNEFARARWTDDEGEVYDAFFSKVALRPFILSPNFIALGIREATKYFDGSDGEEEIFPTIEGIPGKNIVLHSDVIEDNGVFGEDVESIANFNIYLPDFGSDFDLAALLQGDTAIEMKSGYCGGRAFKVHSVERVGSGWKCNCERELDSDLSIYFPYSHKASIGETPIADEAYQVRGSDIQDYEGDRYVLTGIEMTSTYVDAASVRLLKYSLRFLSKNDYTRYTFVPKVDESFMARQHDLAVASRETEQVVKSYYETLKEGDILLFRDTDLGISYETSGSDASVFIDTLRIKEYGNGQIPTYDVTLRDDKQVGTIQRLQEKVSSLSSSLSGGGAGGTNIPQVQSLIKTYGKELFLSKVGDDTASGVISFLKGALFGEGSAWGYVRNGIAWFKNLVADVLKVTNHITGTDGVGGGLTISGDVVVAPKQEGGATTQEGKLEVPKVVSDFLQSYGFTSDILTGTGYGLWIDPATGKSHLEVDILTARMKAYFAQLEIRELSYVGGDYAFTPAGCRVERVVPIDANGNELEFDGVNIPQGTVAWRCYWPSEDDGRTVHNVWKLGDQARCQTFNLGQEQGGVYEGVENRYYWRLVVGRGEGVLVGGNKVNYIDLAEAYNWYYVVASGTMQLTQPSGVVDRDYIQCEGYEVIRIGQQDTSCDIPASEDSVVAFGSQTDKNRQGIIEIKVESGDVPRSAPAINIYEGVDNYTLANRLVIKWSPYGSKLSTQSLEVFSGSSVGEGGEPLSVNRGLWNASATYYRGDMVSYGGELWLCTAQRNVAVVNQVPSESSQYWSKQVSKGADGESGVGLGENLIDHSEAASTFNVSELIEDTLGNDYIRYGLTDKTYVVANIPADGTIVSGRARIRLTNCTFKANVNNSNTDEHGRYGLVQLYIEAKNGSQGTAWPEICQAKVYEDGVLELNHEGFALDSNGGTFDGKVWLSLRNFASGTVSVERVKLEVGEKCSAWSLSENDKKGASGTSRWMVVEPSNVRVYLDDDKLPRLSNNIINTANSPAIKITLYERTNGVTNKVKDGSHFFVDGNVNYNIDGEQDFADPVFSMDESVYEGDGDYFEWDSTNECWRTPVGKTFVKDMPFQWLKFYWRDGNNIYAEQSILLNVDGANGADGNAFTLSPSEFVVTQRYGENVSGWDVANNSVVASGFYRSGNNASEAAAMAIQSVAPSTATGVLKVSQTQTNKLLIDTTALGNIDNGINYITATIRLSKGSLYQDLTFNLYINRLGTLYSQTIGDATETIRQRSGWKYNPTTREWEELALMSYVEESAEGFSRQISALPIQKNLLLNTEFSALSGGGIRAMHVTSVGGGLWLQYTESRKMLPHNNYFMLSFFGRGSGSLTCRYEVYKEGRASAVRSGSATLALSSSTQRQYVRFNTNTTGQSVDEDGYTFIIKFSTTGGGEFYLSRPQLEVIGSATRPTTWSNGSPNILLNSAFSEIEDNAPKYWEYKGSPSARELSIEVPPYWNDWMLWDTTTCPDVLSVVDGVLRLNPTAQYQGITQYSNVGSAGRWEKVLKHGGTYTVSFKAKGADSTNMASFILHVLKIGDDGQPIAVPAGQGRSQIGGNFPIEETWKTYSFTFTISPTGIWNLTEEQTDLAGYGFFFMIGCAHGTQVSSEVLDIKEIQFEAGGVATSWQPASYDAVYRATQIQQTADEISLAVKVDGVNRAGVTLNENGVTIDGDKLHFNGTINDEVTIEGANLHILNDIDLQGLTTENVTTIERSFSYEGEYRPLYPHAINMGVGKSQELYSIKSVQIAKLNLASEDFTQSANHDMCPMVVLPFYDSYFEHWKDQMSHINFNVDSSSALYGSFPLWTKTFGNDVELKMRKSVANGYQEVTLLGTISEELRRSVAWRRNGTRVTITNEYDEAVRNWKYIEGQTWESTNKNIVGHLIPRGILVCSDGRIVCEANASRSNGYAGRASGSVNVEDYAGRFSCGGYIARFILVLPGQSLQLRSHITKISDNQEVLIWVVENASDFVPLKQFPLTFKSLTYTAADVGVFGPMVTTSGANEVILGHDAINSCGFGGLNYDTGIYET